MGKGIVIEQLVIGNWKVSLFKLPNYKIAHCKLGGYFFEQLLINIEVGVHVLHVVAVLQRFH